MKFDLQNKDGLTLKTKGKYVREDIAVGLSESDKSALVPENMVEEASVLGVQGSLKKYDGTFEGEAKVEGGSNEVCGTFKTKLISSDLYSENDVFNAFRDILTQMMNDGFKIYRNKLITDNTGVTTQRISIENVNDMPLLYENDYLYVGLTSEEYSAFTSIGYLAIICLNSLSMPQTWGVVYPKNFINKVYVGSMPDAFSLMLSVSNSGILEDLFQGVLPLKIDLTPRMDLTMAD